MSEQTAGKPRRPLRGSETSVVPGPLIGKVGKGVLVAVVALLVMHVWVAAVIVSMLVRVLPVQSEPE